MFIWIDLQREKSIVQRASMAMSARSYRLQCFAECFSSLYCLFTAVGRVARGRLWSKAGHRRQAGATGVREGAVFIREVAACWS